MGGLGLFNMNDADSKTVMQFHLAKDGPLWHLTSPEWPNFMMTGYTVEEIFKDAPGVMNMLLEDGEPAEENLRLIKEGLGERPEYVTAVKDLSLGEVLKLIEYHATAISNCAERAKGIGKRGWEKSYTHVDATKGMVAHLNRITDLQARLYDLGEARMKKGS